MSMESYKAIFHIDELNKWNQLLANVANLVEDLSKNHLEIEVLANGEAVKYFDSTNDSQENIDKMTTLNQEDVSFVACNNSLTGNDIPKEVLYSFVEVVPAGVSELVRKQHEGFAYIKP